MSMAVVAAASAWALGVLLQASSHFINPWNFFTSPGGISSELGPLLSSDASIFLPGSTQFAEATLRWQMYNEPNITELVEVATEIDIQETIKFANNHDMAFLAVTGGHGSINSLGSISADGKTATIGGGVKAKQVTDALWAVGKQTVTGVCECTGLLGPMLGGGHGILQGRYGLLSDQLLSARMILANGTAITVSSELNPDLFWAISGAGHNFGIVTEVTYKIYDVGENVNWATETFIFTEDKIEDIFLKLNLFIGWQPVELIFLSLFVLAPDIDPDPTVMVVMGYEGAFTIPIQFTAPFRSAGPIVHQSKSMAYTQLTALFVSDNDSPACGHGISTLRFPISTRFFRIQAQRAIYESFRNFITTYPAFNNSFFLFEQYALQGVKAIPEESTAFPHREDNLLISPVVSYAPDAMLDLIAVQFGKDIRQTLHEADGSSELHAYVNYAHGDESLQELYGYEDWRQEKLKGLKREYDPHGRFNFYAPIH